MVLPTRLTVYSFAYALDGGTTVLRATDEAGREHGLTLVQHAFPQPSPSLGAIPGRLYFDDELVPMRSDVETAVLVLLRGAEVRYSGLVPEHGERIQLSPNALVLGDDIRQVLARDPEENIRALVAEVIRFVESDHYLRFAERVEQAADPTRYTVWAAWESATRNRVVVRLGRLLGIGLQAAREMLDRGAPLAEGVSALEVAELVQRYAAEGLPLRIDPAYRWRLS
jgi:hypothetical protein